MALTVQIITILLFTFQESGLSATGDEFDPRDVHFQAIDFNLTLRWNPPNVSLLEGETLLYTVVRINSAGLRTLEYKRVPHCVNISETECYLIPIFSSIKDFAYKERFYVNSMSTVRGNYTGTSNTKGFTNWNVVASAPVIYNYTITTSNITVWIHGPRTPFVKKGKNLFLVEDALRRGKFKLQVIYFNSSLKRDNAIDFEKMKSVQELRDGRAEIVYPHLLPYTNYTLKVQSQLNGKFSADVTSFEFRTKQTAPDVGPVISGIEVMRRYCDYRDVKINWEESKSQRPNVALTEYVVDVTDSETNDTTNITVQASVRSVTLRKLNRWHKYHVMVTSFNSGGRKKGEVQPFEKDDPDHVQETYKPTITSIVEVSPSNWILTWATPRDHEQCIVGYVVEARTSDGSLEEKIFVDGFNTSSASLHLKKPGRYTILLRAKVNGSMDINVETKTEHDVNIVKDVKYREAFILAGLAFLITIISTGIAIMTKKVFCDTSDLPDMAKIKTMNLARDQPVRTSLRKPPEKEIFHATRILPSNYFKSDSSSNYEGENDILQPKSSSTSVLLQSYQSFGEDILIKKIDDEFSSQPILDDANGNQNQVIVSQKNEASCDLPDELPATNTHTEDESCAQSLPGGYVAHSFSNKHPDLKVYIPKVPTLHHQSSSSDSGFSSSPNSQSDYVPPSPFTDSSYFVYTVNPIASHSEENPYIKADVAERHGRIHSTSISSDVAAGCPRYNRIDSRQSLIDPYPKGYLTMSSSLPSQ